MELLKELDRPVQYVIVNEAGASVYSASKLATEEFPKFDVGQRSAVSIARRLQDPLAELVKIDPKSIGVGQYQHDMNQKHLSEALQGVVEDCVNRVGVDLNTASASLLEYVSGVSKTVAKNIVSHREENGAFRNRKELFEGGQAGPQGLRAVRRIHADPGRHGVSGTEPACTRRATARPTRFSRAWAFSRRTWPPEGLKESAERSRITEEPPRSWASVRSRCGTS